jgi:hypothetical protein
MHASEAFLNGAVEGNLGLLNTLLTNFPMLSDRSADERQAEEESKRDSATKPGGFQNDPDDPTNPNEVREHHLKKVKKIKES